MPSQAGGMSGPATSGSLGSVTDRGLDEEPPTSTPQTNGHHHHHDSVSSISNRSCWSSTPFVSCEGQLTCCLICLDNFNKPVALECQHMFCEPCLQFYYNIYRNVQYEQLGVFVPCPTCRQLTKVPSNGLMELVLDPETHSERMRKISLASEVGMQRCETCVYKGKVQEAQFYCTKCLLNMCEQCNKVHEQQPLLKVHSVIHISNKETVNLSCERHSKLPSGYFCLDCNVAACVVCIMQEHATGHHTAKLRDALAMRRDSMKTTLNSFGPRLDKLEMRLKHLQQLHAIQVRHREGSNHLSPDSSGPTGGPAGSLLRRISLQEDQTSEAQLRSYTFHIERLKKLFDLAAKTVDMSQSKRLLAIYTTVVARIQTVLDVELRQLQDEIEARVAREREGMTEFLSHGGSVNSGSTGSLPNDGTGTHSVSSGDSSPDDHLQDLVQHSILVKPKLLWKVEHQRNDTAELSNPCDLTFLPDGNLVVAEYDVNMNSKNNRLLFLDNTGKSAGVIAQGQIRPLGVTITRKGNIAVTDCKDKRIKIFTLTGQLMTEIGKSQFGWPYGIAVASKGQIVVSDAFNDTVIIFSEDGKKLKSFGTSGCGQSQFKNPYHIALDSQDNILVSDSGNDCVKVFDISGKYLYRTADRRRSSHSGQAPLRRKRILKGPRGISIDVKGNILVADDRSRVCLFDQQGHFHRNLLTEEDSVKYPEALASNAKGQLAVTEWNPNNMYAIKVFDMYAS